MFPAELMCFTTYDAGNDAYSDALSIALAKGGSPTVEKEWAWQNICAGNFAH